MKMNQERIELRETSAHDLEHVMRLWNSGEVMHFVGFPNGIGITLDELKQWLGWAVQKPLRCHYSIYAEGIGYCGETFYHVDPEHGLAALDIKLFPCAQGKGIAQAALTFAIDQAFSLGGAERVYVDPHPDNRSAWALYEKLGFAQRPRPARLEGENPYLELTADLWSI